jgi:hypothetical protein
MDNQFLKRESGRIKVKVNKNWVVSFGLGLGCLII